MTFLVLLISAIPVWTQQTAQPVWQGVLRNAAGAPIVAAKVRLVGTASAEALTAVDGRFQLAPLLPGQYRLTVEADGRTVDYAQSIDLAPNAASVEINLSDRGELSVAELKGQAATGGEQLSNQAVASCRSMGAILGHCCCWPPGR